VRATQRDQEVQIQAAASGHLLRAEQLARPTADRALGGQEQQASLGAGRAQLLVTDAIGDQALQQLPSCRSRRRIQPGQ